MSRHNLGIMVESPFTLPTIRQYPPADRPRDFALTAPPNTPLYDESPLDRYQRPNAYNFAIMQEWKVWKRAKEQGLPGSGGTPGSGSGSGSGNGTGSGSGSGSGSGYGSGSGSATGGAGNSIFTAYANNPIAVMPDNGQPLHYFDSIATPAPGSSATVVSFYVPDGWIAIVKGVTNLYASAGFVNGDGQLIWRIDKDGEYPPGFENIKTNLGNTEQPWPLSGAIIAVSGQLVRYTISTDAAATCPTGSTAPTVCGFDGYFVPAL